MDFYNSSKITTEKLYIGVIDLGSYAVYGI